MKNSSTSKPEISTLLAALCDSMHEGALIVEAVSGDAVYCNTSFRELFAISEPATINLSMIRGLRKEPLAPAAIKHQEQLIAEKGVLTDLVEYMSLNGQSFFAEATIRLFKTRENSYYLYILNPLDRSFFELISMGIVMVNQHHEIVTANPFLLARFGYEKHEIIGKKIEYLIPDRFHDRHTRLRSQWPGKSVNRPMGIGMDLFAKRKDGSEFPVEISLANYVSEGDKYIIAFINDISIRKKAEDDLKSIKGNLELLVQRRTLDLNNTLNELEESKHQLKKMIAFQKSLLDNAGAIIVSVDNNGIIQTFNPEAERKLGYTADELVGKQTPLILHDPELLSKRAKEFSREQRKDIPVSMELFFSRARQGLDDDTDWIYVRKDGSKFPVQLHIASMRDAAGDVIGFTGVALDISKLKETEQELQQALEKEKDLGELKSRFVTMASHEFRTPLSTILSSAYLIEKYTATNEQPKRYSHIQRIISSVNSLTDILNDFLSVGKIEEGKIPVRWIEFNITELVKSIIEEIKHTLKPNQHISYVHNGDSDVLLDPSLIKHIIMNMVSNASKFSPENTTIYINTIQGANQLSLSVKDSGIGISTGDQQHLMERFFRGSNAGNIQGTGLGLHIVSKYAELMNGTVHCNSEPGKGSTFSINFHLKTSQYEKDIID